MVRLKWAEPTAATEELLFQFHYGSIKIELTWDDESTLQKFQFHYGSIKMGAGGETFTNVMRFNSTMVRLKSCRGRILPPGHVQFQFHYGSIKMLRWLYRRGRCCCFNSTMVRLKYIYDQPKPGGIVFQFHYGSIKITNSHRRGKLCYVSIPLWFD